MVKEFEEFIESHSLFSRNNRIILAVSGGVDSVVMADLFLRSGYNIAIAHCNFRLRAKDSGGDAEFVEEFAKKNGLPFFKRGFNTRAAARKKGISVQMAARDLRYKWFNQLLRLNNYDYIATAHHADDEIETFFINLIRGTGISGLQGITLKSHTIVRPLLFTCRDKIMKYALENNIDWREDKSNKETKYLRNRIRKEIVPLFTETSANFKTNMYDNMHRIHNAVKIYYKEIENMRNKCVMHLSNCSMINTPKLMELDTPQTYLYEFLKPFGFSYEITLDIFRSISSQSGKVFFSPSHKVLKDRDYLLIERKSQSKHRIKEWLIHDTEKGIKEPVEMQFEILDYQGGFRRTNNEHIAHLDFDKLSFPLILRHWKAGDFFYPLGMSNRKKLSDFFTDIKLNLSQKQNTWLLCSGKDVVWVAGHRIDNRYKITPGTRKMLKITLID